MKSCAEARLWLNAYVDGELDLAQSLELEQHLKACEACAAQRNSIRSLRTAMEQNELRFAASASLREKVLPKSERRPENSPAPSSFRVSLWRWSGLAEWSGLGLAFAAVLLLVVLRAPSSHDSQADLLDEVISDHVRSLQAQHLTDVLSSDQHTVKPWFEGKLDFAPEVRDYAAQGYTLIGGRLDYLDHRPAAALVYQHNKHFINVFIQPRADEKKDAATTAVRRGYPVTHFEANGFAYYLVSDMEAGGLEQFAQVLQQK